MSEQSSAQTIAEEDRLRANLYALLARLLSDAPDGETLRLVGAMTGDETELGGAISALAEVARGTTVGAAKDEYFNLFIGISKGELLPFASYYLTGFLNEKPVARLRGDMAKLGIARADGVNEPEDHIASLCEMMAGLITGSFGAPAPLAVQQDFFYRHIGCWAPRFFEDLQASRSAAFFMPVGAIGQRFMGIETQAFEMAA